jgi:hypothetical protein
MAKKKNETARSLPVLGIIPVVGLFGAKVVKAVTFKAVNITLFQAVPTAAELFFLGPLGPFIVGTAWKVALRSRKIPGYVASVIEKKNPVAIALYLAGSPLQWYQSLGMGHKFMLTYGIMHQLYGTSRRYERLMRATGVQAMRRLDGAGAFQNKISYDMRSLFL